MKLRNALCALLVCIMTVGCLSGSAKALELFDDNEDQVWTNFVPESDDDAGIQLLSNSVYYFQNDPIYNAKSDNSFSYWLTDEFQYAKIWIKNEGSAPITASSYHNGSFFGGGPYTITNETKNNQNQIVIFVTGNGNTGKFEIDINSTNGETLYGQISIKVGTKEGVGYPW